MSIDIKILIQANEFAKNTSEIFRLPPLTPSRPDFLFSGREKQFQGSDMLGSVHIDVDRSLPLKKIDQALAVTNNYNPSSKQMGSLKNTSEIISLLTNHLCFLGSATLGAGVEREH